MEKTHPNFFSVHLSRKKSACIIPRSALQKGMIIQNRYNKDDGTTREYFFLILNPEFHKKVHVLSLNEMSLTKFNNMAQWTGVRIIPKYRKRALELPKLIMNESSRRFYHGKLSMHMEKLYDWSYRTLRLSSLGLIQLIDYQFEKNVEDNIIG